MTAISSQNSFELNYKTARTFFIGFCLAHALIWILIPSLLYPNPPTDTLEGIAWGNLWLWGYEKHPFLAPWITNAVSNLFGIIGWPLYLLSQLCVVICFWATWRLANHLLKPASALISVLLLEGIIFYNTEAYTFNPNLLMLALWSLTVLTFYKAVKENKIHQWIFLGICAGLGLVAKYEIGLLFITLFIVLFITTEGRRCFLKPGIYIAALISFLIFLPNLLWLAHHQFIAIRYALGEMDTDSNNINTVAQSLIDSRIIQPFYFIRDQIGTLIPLLILFLPFYKNMKPHFDLNRFDQRFLVLISIFPLAFTILLALISGSSLVVRWAFPFYSTLGILLVAWAHPLITPLRLKKLMVLLVGLTLLLFIGNMYVFQIKPYHQTNNRAAEFFPGRSISNYLTQQWQTRFHTPLDIIAGDRQTIVNVAVFSADKPKPYFDSDPEQSPWLSDQEVRQKGAIFVEQVTHTRNTEQIQAIFKQLKRRFPRMEPVVIIPFKKLTAAKINPAEIWIAYLPPENDDISKAHVSLKSSQSLMEKN